MIYLQSLIVLVFLLIHLFAGKLHFLGGIPRSRWLSFAGGVSVAYVFIHIFPELAEAQESIGGEGHFIPWIEHHAYLVALAGLAAFYGLERLIKSARQEGAPENASEDETSTGRHWFWLHIASFSFYNALIGYLLVHREEQDIRGLLMFGAAMGVHFLVNDYGLRHHHKSTYRRRGRWVLMAAILLGWIVGLATEISEAAVGALFAFLAGGVVLNVLKEELPEERQSRFGAFAVGVALYAALLLLV